MLATHPRIRLGIYLVGILAQVASFFVAIVSPELGDAFSQTSAVLGAIALTTAVTNLDTKEGDQ